MAREEREIFVFPLTLLIMDVPVTALKTVEIIVEEKPWLPLFCFKDGDIAAIVVAFEETELRAKLQKMRAKWDPNLKVWLIPYHLIRGTELETRIPEDYLNGSKRI